MSKKLRILWIITLIFTFCPAVMYPQPALAASRLECKGDPPNKIPPYNTICVQQEGNLVRGTLSGWVNDRTLIVKQCDGKGRNCTTIAATHGDITSWKNVARGHVYQACASFTNKSGDRRTNICSPFIAVPI